MKLKRLSTPGAFVIRDQIADQDRLLALLKMKIPWKEMTWGTGNKLPRKVCHGADCPVEIQGILLDILVKIVNEINVCRHIISPGLREIVLAKYGFFCNYYRNEKDYTPFHEDQYGGDIISLSFGATREFQFKRKSDNSVESFQLNGGDVLFFARAVNDTHKHSVIKGTAPAGERINITFFLG